MTTSTLQTKLDTALQYVGDSGLDMSKTVIVCNTGMKHAIGKIANYTTISTGAGISTVANFYNDIPILTSGFIGYNETL